MTINLRTAIASTVAASLSLLLAGPAVAANDSAESTSALSGGALVRFPEFAGLKDSASLDAPTMLQGTLTDVAGKALGGAQVLLAAWPSNDAVHKLPIGGEFSAVPVARTLAGKNGAYELRSLLTPLLSSLSGTDGLDIKLDVFHGGRHYVYLSQLKEQAGSWVHDFVRGVDAQTATGSANQPNLLDLALDPATGEKLAQVADGRTRIQADDHPFPGVPCLRYKKVDTKEAWTTLVTAVARNGTALHTTYAEGAKTVTSTGFSFDKGVSFSINGARERTASVEAKYLTQKTKRGKAMSRSYDAQMAHDVLRRSVSATTSSTTEFSTSPLLSA